METSSIPRRILKLDEGQVELKPSASQHLEPRAYDAFLALAEILGVPPKAASLNAWPRAIGAQGNGTAAAHLCPA